MVNLVKCGNPCVYQVCDLIMMAFCKANADKWEGWV